MIRVMIPVNYMKVLALTSMPDNKEYVQNNASIIVNIHLCFMNIIARLISQ